MALSNIDFIYMEYPFVAEYLSRRSVTRAQVSRWSIKFLGTTNLYHQYANFVMFQEFYLVDSDGKIVTQIGTGKGFWERLFSRDSRPCIESVGEALYRLGKQSSIVRYAVSCLRRGGDCGNELTLFKIPTGFNNAEEWLAKAFEADRKEMQDI